jgi:hypothetical protein
MLKPKALQTETVQLEEVTYTVSAMTVRKRTNFEAVLVRNGADRIREALLVYCVSLPTGLPEFDAAEFLDKVEIDETGLGRDQLAERREAAAIDMLLDYLAAFPADQLEPLVQACQRVNDMLGNGSAPS